MCCEPVFHVLGVCLLSMCVVCAVSAGTCVSWRAFSYGYCVSVCLSVELLLLVVTPI